MTRVEMSSDTRTTGRPRFGAWLLITSLCALLMFAYHYLDDFASGDTPRFAKAFIEEITGVFASSSLFLFVRRVARRYPISRATWRRSAPAHLGALLLFGVTATSLNWASRTLLYWIAGLGPYDYGIMRFRYLMEFPLQTIGYALMVSAVWLFDRLQAEREAALRAAQLESQLRQAQLQELRLQLQPHFLFNALNTISSTMYDDPGAADTMIARLAELLRVSLRTTQMQEVPLTAELEALGHYVALLRARFGDRLHITIEVDEALRQALVPSLVLQPLVENAVRHGNLSRLGTGRIEVRARRDGEVLSLTVEDDGPGPEPGAPANGVGSGVGLHATRERLRLLHGGAARLTLHTEPDRSAFRVELTLPLRLASDAVSHRPAPSATPIGEAGAGGDADRAIVRGSR